ncbi:serine/threonine-protein kinase [Aetokthonos hydrillicola Thurmond2011]|jgi:serine/threonine protein kinase|uniref:Serine/threonine-protein kinase n=1 Tax=Aetokthonos hydrillicola Thurmond2011 TaxID=2712845 RepID=A0AAP5ID33_9CYAN|nr:serine/threonine-protein kinase [Aetokthonos hydrillicola]MBO3462741.1 protein kinase [Aetokthonos hydrillicola CCALA 1050]MBW4585747.1 GUN4 domain-containing protein [Aetokthonos hydrillicola CCALA 1050]MDR9899251.1 serine/threonine-protein kinase [Aetokthonos hydrillicola Thurmond2011]
MILWTPDQSLQDGRFIIQKVLGSGGYGITYSMVEQSTGKLFVIKTLNHIQQSQPDFQQQQVKFVNEALRLSRCAHPHIVQVYELIEEQGLWGMVMEYIDGQDLQAYLQEHGQLSESEALRYIDQIGQALDYVHQRGFLHRDIKPANILLRSGTLHAVLIDFGLAREFRFGQSGSMTNSKTEGYAPIEQYDRKGNFGAYTDVYALAATLYTLLTDEVPFPSNFRKYAQLPPPKEHNPAISDRVNDAIMAAMAFEPEDRIQTVREWLELVIPSNTISFIPQAPTLNLKLDNGIDLVTAKVYYTQLEHLLAAGEWQEADKETLRLMLILAAREDQGWLREQDINILPCEDLCTIDQLWVKYSGGQFGFSVQKSIYESLGEPTDYNRKFWELFSDQIGWRSQEGWINYKDLTFDLTAPVAHLPGLVHRGCTLEGEKSLFSRIEYCCTG